MTPEERQTTTESFSTFFIKLRLKVKKINKINLITKFIATQKMTKMGLGGTTVSGQIKESSG